MPRLLSVLVLLWAGILNAGTFETEPLILGRTVHGRLPVSLHCLVPIRYDFPNTEGLAAVEVHAELHAFPVLQSRFSSRHSNPPSISLLAKTDSGHYRMRGVEHRAMRIPLDGGPLRLIVFGICARETRAIPFDLRLRAPADPAVTLTGWVLDVAGGGLAGAQVSLWTADGRFVDSATSDPEGAYTLMVAPGAYLLGGIHEGVNVFYSGKPREKATLIYAKADLSRNLTIGSDRPVIDAVGGALIKGEPMRISGSAFGDTKSYIGFGGYLTNSSSYIDSWTDTEIHLSVPSNAIPGCLRIFAKTGGWSDCYEIPDPDALGE